MPTRLPIQTMRPQHPTLRKYIEYYYFWDVQESDFLAQFQHFPHYRTALNIYKGSQVDLSKTGRRLSPGDRQQIEAVLATNWEQALMAHLEGPQQVVGILFSLLGAPQFFPWPLGELPDEPAISLTERWPLLLQTAESWFGGSLPERAHRLDQFFLAQFKNRDLPILEAWLPRLQQGEGSPGVQDWTQQQGISRRTLHRQMVEHLGASSNAIKRVLRFREAIKYLHSSRRPNLTHLAYQAGYYDQADFIKHFRKLTGQTPRQTLPYLEQVGSEDLWWQFQMSQTSNF